MRFTGVLVLLLGSFALSPTAAQAAPAKYCQIDMSQKSERCYTTAGDLRAYQATTTLYTALIVWNWNNFNDDGGYRVYVMTRPRCADNGFTADASDINLSDSYYENKPTISMNNSIGSWITASDCFVRFWDYNNMAGPWVPEDPYGDPLFGACGVMQTCTDEGDWNNKAGALVVY